jgi:ubiquinone/menaquinone biosynthesis C-methylase UbiE
MNGRETKRVGVREGYDLWATPYDQTPNPVVAMDSRHTLNLLDPKPGQKILDAGCGTGRNLSRLRRAGAKPYGLDFSLGMLRVAQENIPKNFRSSRRNSQPCFALSSENTSIN